MTVKNAMIIICWNRERPSFRQTKIDMAQVIYGISPMLALPYSKFPVQAQVFRAVKMGRWSKNPVKLAGRAVPLTNIYIYIHDKYVSEKGDTRKVAMFMRK